MRGWNTPHLVNMITDLLASLLSPTIECCIMLKAASEFGHSAGKL